MDEAYAAAHRVVAEWPLEPTRIERVSQSENIVFRVDCTDDTIYVLRLHRPGYHSFDELVSEQAWTSALRDAGLGAPRALYTSAGEPYALTRVGDEQRYAGVLEWVDGDTMLDLIDSSIDDDYVAQRYMELGRLIAALHNQATGWSLPAGFCRHHLDHHGLMGDQPFWGRFWESGALNDDEQQWCASLRERIYPLLEAYGKRPKTYSLIHADLHPGNVIVHGTNLHIIDFDDSGFGWHLYDLAVAVMPYRNDSDFEANRDALLEGYRELRPLDEADAAMLPLFIVVRALAQIGWIAARPEFDGDSLHSTARAYAQINAEQVIRDLERSNLGANLA